MDSTFRKTLFAATRQVDLDLSTQGRCRPRSQARSVARVRALRTYLETPKHPLKAVPVSPKIPGGKGEYPSSGSGGGKPGPELPASLRANPRKPSSARNRLSGPRAHFMPHWDVNLIQRRVNACATDYGSNRTAR